MPLYRMCMRMPPVSGDAITLANTKCTKLCFFQIGLLDAGRFCAQEDLQVMPDDHSKVEPLLPIPNRTVKRFCADDSEQLACESRLSSGFYRKPGSRDPGFFLAARSVGLRRSRIGRLPRRADAGVQHDDDASPSVVVRRAYRRRVACSGRRDRCGTLGARSCCAAEYDRISPANSSISAWLPCSRTNRGYVRRKAPRHAKHVARPQFPPSRTDSTIQRGSGIRRSRSLAWIAGQDAPVVGDPRALPVDVVAVGMRRFGRSVDRLSIGRWGT